MPVRQASPEAFVRAWQAAKKPEEVAAALGMTKRAVCTRAERYRAKGVRLKRLDWTLDIEALNKLAERGE